MNYKLLFIIALFTLAAYAQNREHAFEVNQRLGRGINFGNMFEAPSEDAWGNPYDSSYPKLIADKGFNHVRIPIRWEPEDRSLSTDPFTINIDFLNRIKEVVDECMAQGLMAVINMHHHEALFEDPAGNKARFLAQWDQIATFFKDYPDDLLFEVLNEPHSNLTPELWNVYLKDALLEIRKTNNNRIVLIGTASYGGLTGLSDLVIPADDDVIVTIHYYNPFPFTHQGAEWVDNSDEWLGTKWHDTQNERDVVIQEMKQLQNFEIDINIPVHIGEFGSYSKADETSRLKWTTFLGRYFEQLNWSWAYWEFSAGFGIYDPDTKAFYDELVDALLVNEMPEPTEVKLENIYTSDFSDDFDGWSLSNQGGASSNLSRVNGALKVAISNGGTASWHVQLSKNGFALKNGETYQLRFRARSTVDKNVSGYLGMNKSPWSQYGSTNAFVTDEWEDFQLLFVMNSDDNDARIVFDMGNSLGNVEITDIIFDRVIIGTLGVGDVERRMQLYPNPVRDSFYYFNEHFENMNIYDYNGRVIKAMDIAYGHHEVPMDFLKPGLYFVVFKGTEGSAFKKIIKM